MKQYCKKCIYKILPYYERHYLPNQVIFLEGEKLDLVYRIEEGYVKMHRYYESGDEKILSILGPGDYISLIAVLKDQNNYIASAMSLTKTKLQVIDKYSVKNAYNSNDLFKDNCVNCAITRTHFFQFQITQFSNLNTEEKILNTLLNLHQKFGDKLSNTKSMTLPFSKSILANIIGIRRETLSRYLSVMQEKKVLKVDKNFYVFL